MNQKKKNKLITFISYYKDHLGLFAIDIFCALIVAAIDLAAPMATRYSIQSLLPDKLYSEFFVVIAILVSCYIIRMGLTFLITYLGHYVGVLIETDMRKDLFSHIQKLSFSYYDQIRTGHLMSRVTSDLFEITELAHHGPEDFILSVVMLIGSFFMLATINLKLTVILFIAIPIMIGFMLLQRKKMQKVSIEVKKKTAGINADIESAISGIRVAKAFTTEEHELDKFTSGNEVYKKARRFYFKRMAIFHSGMEMMTNTLYVVVLLFGGMIIMNGEMDVIELITFNLYVASFLNPIKKMTQFMEQFTSGMAGFNRMQEIMDIRPDIEDKPDAIKLKDVKGEIEFENVSFSYKDNEPVLKNISLKINKGKKIALVGPSGGGKSTICQLIPRFYDIDSGSVKIDGIDIRNVTMRSLRENIGIVQQDVFLFADTIKNNIKYGNLKASDEEVIQAAKSAEIHDFIMSLEDGYDTFVGERGVLLSGGQKQRISIARVFLKNPPILILDEATSALDTDTEYKIQKALDALALGRTSIVVAHRLSTIKDADEIAVIIHDSIAETGTHEELLKIPNGKYKALYNAQYAYLQKHA